MDFIILYNVCGLDIRLRRFKTINIITYAISEVYTTRVATTSDIDLIKKLSKLIIAEESGDIVRAANRIWRKEQIQRHIELPDLNSTKNIKIAQGTILMQTSELAQRLGLTAF